MQDVYEILNRVDTRDALSYRQLASHSMATSVIYSSGGLNLIDLTGGETSKLILWTGDASTVQSNPKLFEDKYMQLNCNIGNFI